DRAQCWRYVNGVTGDSLPRKLLIQIEWEATDTRLNKADSSISVGMGSPAAQAAPKRFLLRSAAREMALVGLAQMSRGGALRPEVRVRSTLIEESWLDQVRASGQAENITVASQEDAPVLRQTSAQAEARPGTTLELRLAIEDAGRDLSPGSVFVVDEHSGHVVE